jgi:hypothetical protein
MEPHQRLKLFVPKLREGLRREGIAERRIAAYEFHLKMGIRPGPLRNQKDYEDAWTACHVAMNILTNDEDGSEAAHWLRALTHRVFDYEDAFKASHGCQPLNPGGPEWVDGPTGTA